MAMSTLTPDPEIDAIFDEPPSADEWRSMARAIADAFAIVLDVDQASQARVRAPLVLGPAPTAEDVLRHTLRAVRKPAKVHPDG